MEIWYVTNDEVNASLAIKTGARWGLTVRLVDHRSLASCQPDIVVYDRDSLAPRISKCSSLMPQGRIKAVHSYNLTRKLVRDLRSEGVVVGRRLSARFIRRILKAAQKPLVGTNV